MNILFSVIFTYILIGLLVLIYYERMVYFPMQFSMDHFLHKLGIIIFWPILAMIGVLVYGSILIEYINFKIRD